VRAASAVAALVVAVGAATPAAAQDSRDWKQLTTAGFTVVGDADARDLQRVGDEIARFRDALRTMRPNVRVDPDAPLVVVVFRDEGVMRPYKLRDRHGTPMDYYTAWFGPSPDVNYVVTSADGLAGDGAGLAFRSYASHVVARNLRRAPFWLNQGLTEFYGSFTTRDRDGKTYVGAPVARHVDTFKHLSPVPLADLIATGGSAGYRRGREEAARASATAWALTHYLVVGRGGELRPLLGQYLAATESGEPSAAAFTRIFGPDLALLEKAVRQHIALLKLPALVLADARAGDTAAPTPMSEADAQQLRADLLVRLGQPALADPYVSRALAAAPGHAGARVVRARSLLLQQKPLEALAALADFGPDGGGRVDVHLTRGTALRQAERYPEAVAAYRQAAALRPDSPSIQYELSIALMGAGEPEAVAAFTRCVTLRPGGDWYQLRQRQGLRLGIDTYLVSDAINWTRLEGWPEDETTSYVMLIKAITELRLGKPADAAATLTEIAAHHKAGDWVLSLVAFFRSEIAGDALVAKARDDGQRTEAHAYAGIKASMDGEREAARRHFAWVRASGRSDYYEYDYVLGELKRLDRPAAPR